MSRELAYALVVLDRVMDRVKAALTTAREQATGDMLAGERFAAVLPDGTSPGFIQRRADVQEPYVADEAALFAHVQDTDPDALQDVDELVPGGEDEALRVLKQHAPHLVASGVRLNPTVLAGYLKAAKADPAKAVPGIRFKTKSGTVAVYPDKDMVASLDEAIRDGRVSLDTVIKQIEGARDGDQDA